MAMNPRLLRPTREPLLLDFAPGAAAAYSLRQLSSGYAGPVVTVRRSSDDVEDSFTAKEVSDGTLAAFCGANDGFVKTWHSQTGSNDASQTTEGYQPKIVSSGVVVTEEGKPAIQCDGTDDFLKSTSFPAIGTGDISTFVLFRFFNTTGYRTPLHVGGVSAFSGLVYAADGANNDGSLLVGRVGGNFIDTSTSTNFVATVLTGIRTGLTAFSLFFNGASTSPASGNPSGMTVTSGLAIGSLNGVSQFLDGTVSEVIVYPSDLTAQRERIEGNIAWSYS